MANTDVPTEPFAPSALRPTPSTSVPNASRPWRLRGVRVFSSAADDLRLRRPTDVLLLVSSLFVLTPLAIAAPGPSSLDTSIAHWLAQIPGISLFSQTTFALLSLWPAILILISLAARGRKPLLVSQLVALMIAVGFALVVGLAAGTTSSATLSAITATSGPETFVAIRFAVATSLIVVSSPHLSRPVRRLGRAVLLGGAIGTVGLSVAWPIAVVAALFVGVTAAAVSHLIIGSPGGRLTADDVDDALDQLHVVAHDVRHAEVQVSGYSLYTATAASGDSIRVAVYGRDAWDGQFLGSIWTALTHRGERPHIGRGRLDQVEHEAVVTLLAERCGVAVLPVYAVGATSDGDALLVTQAVGEPLSLSSDLVSDDTLASIWRTVVALHAAGISHGQIDDTRIVVMPDDTLALRDFAAAELAAPQEAFMTDRARLLVSTAAHVGHERAVAGAASVIGSDGLAELLPYLQPAALDRATRAAVKAGEWDLGDLRTAAVAAAGVEPPPLVKIQRVTVRGVLILTLAGLLVYALVSRLAGVDFSSIVSELSAANKAMLFGALLLSPLIQVGFSFSTLGASTTRLRYVPVLMLQYAIQFIAVALPATAARLALEVRFFERFGVPTAGALSIGVIDSVSGFVVQVALILLITLSDLPGLTGSVGAESTTSTSTASSGPSLMLVALALLVLSIVIGLLIPKYRHRLFELIPRVMSGFHEQRVTIQNSLRVLRQPTKVTQLLTGNLAAQIVQACVLGICLISLGQSAHLSQLILINTLVSLFAGLMPMPGGVGVAEAGYTAGLQAIGIPSAIAVSTAVAFRLVTFYLPPIWGAASMKWLRRRDYV